MEQKTTREWDLYQKGLDFYRRLNLFAEVDKCERFYAFDHWHGVKSNGLPTPVLPVITRIVDYKVAQIMSNSLKMQFSIQGFDETVQPPAPELLLTSPDEFNRQLERYQQMQNYERISNILNGHSVAKWESLKMDSILERALLDAAVTGDCYIYFPWDDTIQVKGVFDDMPIMGDFTAEILDNVNVFLGNPNDPRINYAGKPVQPYIIIAYRALVEDLREEAKANGIPEEEVQRIVTDQEFNDQSGDKAKIELDDSGKTICLLYLRYDRQSKTIFARKSTKYARIRDEYDTGKKLYPIAGMNWRPRKNSCHGEGEVKALIPNQLQINKLLAMLIVSVMRTAFPKMIYDKTRFPASGPSNAIGEAIGVDGVIGNVKDLVTYLDGANASPQAYTLLDTIISYTKEMMGANEVALGEVKPDNTSAFIAVNQAAAQPLIPIQRRFYQMVEDIAHIWLDYWLTNYNVPRELSVIDNGVQSIAVEKLSDYRDLMFSIKVDIGPSSQWSEVSSIQSLDNLLNANRIDIIQYLERMPNGIIPKKQELIDEIKAQMEQQQMLQQQLQQVTQQLQQNQIIPQQPAL